MLEKEASVPLSNTKEQAVLQRQPEGRIAGVCAGLAKYTGVDVDLIRVAAVVLCILTLGLAGVVYLTLWATLPVAQSAAAPGQVEVDASDCSSYVYGQVASGSGESPVAGLSLPVSIALVVGVTTMVVGMCILLAGATTAFEPLQFWPLAILAAGVVRMVLPDRHGRRAWPFLTGMAVLLVGMVALLDSLGLVRMMWVRWAATGWPLLAIAIALFVAGSRMKSSQAGPWMLVGGVAMVVVFLVFGFVTCLYPGYVQQVVVVLPNGQMMPLTL